MTERTCAYWRARLGRKAERMQSLTRYQDSLLGLLGLRQAWVDAGDDEAKARVWDTALRQTWATPQDFVDGLSVLSGLDIGLDLCAEPSTAKARLWYGMQPDGSSLCGLEALRRSPLPLGAGAVAWCNPDFRRKSEWVQAIRARDEGVLLNVPSATDQPWFGDLHEDKRSHLSVITGRVSYIPPGETKGGRPNGPTVMWAVNFDVPPLPPVLRWREVMDLGRGAQS